MPQTVVANGVRVREVTNVLWRLKDPNPILRNGIFRNASLLNDFLISGGQREINQANKS